MPFNSLLFLFLDIIAVSLELPLRSAQPRQYLLVIFKYEGLIYLRDKYQFDISPWGHSEL
ncbi:MAG: hypothetical protein A2144_06715 [Chloroflexi bacterium RBG_16_50_9]|nr:MAG: hypothetical protein A2144_06715 [Chloroflexi bacterium RBG_16_50_9]